MLKCERAREHTPFVVHKSSGVNYINYFKMFLLLIKQNDFIAGYEFHNDFLQK